ncbi:unnamed protein product [Lepeophtheirus salmonis]|uniref:(salmon louse) hypothetical protein n=1 Tax=Lepeophtheirus salmonis TaxID=72036 RepID=A0A7R8D1N2_LEPSM|nr:unnamed protein product [Lepeophtheirus salmonis]CAF2997481.1 unnamed protein product [Lepeophtheirus salmonis]
MISTLEYISLRAAIVVSFGDNRDMGKWVAPLPEDHISIVKLAKIETESELDDYDASYLAEEPIPDLIEECNQLLVPEASIYVDCNINKAEASKTTMERVTIPEFVQQKDCNLKPQVLLDLPENPTHSSFLNQLRIS